MANMFKCALAGGGDGASLIVTCTQNFAGATITLTNGTKTYTQVCPLSSPYEVTFESVATGVWTVSGIAQGQTFSTSVTITDFEALLVDIPEGSTATPTDDIQIWLHCANIWDKTYTTISQILSDASTLQALIASTNATNYMVRSTTWASDVTSDSSAMSYIGLNDYCADSLLADSTWLNAICDSSYFENVLNVKVPTMTSNTTPSGRVYGTNNGSEDSTAYRAFDGNTNTVFYYYTYFSPSYQQARLWYMFTEPMVLKKIELNRTANASHPITHIIIEGSNDGSVWNTIKEMDVSVTTAIADFVIDNLTAYKYISFRFKFANSGNERIDLRELQFYGRA